MLALLAEGNAQARKYTEASYEVFGRCAPQSGAGLARGMHSPGMGVACDWCHNLRNDARRAEAARKMPAALDAYQQVTGRCQIIRRGGARSRATPLRSA